MLYYSSLAKASAKWNQMQVVLEMGYYCITWHVVILINSISKKSKVGSCINSCMCNITLMVISFSVTYANVLWKFSFGLHWIVWQPILSNVTYLAFKVLHAFLEDWTHDLGMSSIILSFLRYECRNIHIHCQSCQLFLNLFATALNFW